MFSPTIVNTYHVGYPDIDGLGAGFIAVLVRKPHGPLKVYSGIVKLPDVNSSDYEAARQDAAHRIARFGSPEPFVRAQSFFPPLTEDRYDE